jgi:hypothetical protein
MSEVATEAPPKSYYVLGTNWYCYVHPEQNDLDILKGDDFLIELCTKALDAYFGDKKNETLTVMDKEVEPMIGVLLGITEKGKEDDDKAMSFVPSYFPLGNCGNFNGSVAAQKAYIVFQRELQTQMSANPPKKKRTPKSPPSNSNEPS